MNTIHGCYDLSPLVGRKFDAIFRKSRLPECIVEFPRNSITMLRQPVVFRAAFFFGCLAAGHDQLPSVTFSPDVRVYEQVFKA